MKLLLKWLAAGVHNRQIHGTGERPTIRQESDRRWIVLWIASHRATARGAVSVRACITGDFVHR